MTVEFDSSKYDIYKGTDSIENVLSKDNVIYDKYSDNPPVKPIWRFSGVPSKDNVERSYNYYIIDEDTYKVKIKSTASYGSTGSVQFEFPLPLFCTNLKLSIYNPVKNTDYYTGCTVYGPSSTVYYGLYNDSDSKSSYDLYGLGYITSINLTVHSYNPSKYGLSIEIKDIQGHY